MEYARPMISGWRYLSTRGAFVRRGLAVVLCASAPAWAQETRPEEPLSEVIDVVGKVPDPEPMDRASQRDPSSVVTVISVEERGGTARDTADILATSPGVSVQDSGGYGQSKSLVVRGASSNGTLVLLDGIPLNGAGGNTDLSRIPLALAREFEVMRGSAGARYGSGGLGGVVNIVTRSPGDTVSLSGELSYGSWNTATGWLAATAPLLDSELLLLLHGGTSSGDFPYPFDPTPTFPGDAPESRRRDNNDARGLGALLRLRHRLAPGVVVDAMAEGALDGRGLAGTAQNPVADARQSNRRGVLSLRLLGSLAGGIQLSARAHLRQEHLKLSGGPVAQRGEQSLLAGGAEVEGRMPLGRAHVLSLTSSVGREGLTTEGEPTGTTPRTSWLRASVMAMDDVSLFDGDLHVTPSVRLERVGRYTLLSPKVGARMSLPARLEVRANVGQTHRAPSLMELYVRQGTLLPNPDLRPERAVSADVALAHRTEHSLVSVGGFHTLYEDLIAYEAYPPFAAKPSNFSSASVSGLEVDMEARPTSFLSGSLAYTFLVSRNLRDDPRYYLRDLPHRPRHTLSARVALGPSWLTGRAELRAQSSQFRNRTGELVLPGRALLHAGLSSTVGRRPALTFSLDFKNLLDAHVEDFDGYPLPGRTVLASVAMTLDLSPTPPRKDPPP
ncbi:TonB-dependent receptor [Myxococcus stipitatus DSM 14675]|uniref:TonB-dependent receptor n=1 Tax=Myxococcus stipitatus (strain DSM 14675 / JCM 12634 / Mx s8) TaxID=1278073 RepID=L7U409_MYXSD|nr:TonB-dependent receptor [Myxococcus stipitatus DSM 14675]